MDSASDLQHVFVVNPAAGSASAESQVKQALRSLGEGVAASVYVTTAPGDATRYVRSLCETAVAPLRFYACGGDGTLNEVVNGAVGFPGVSVGCWPSGSGNDYVKIYGGRERFLNVQAQIHGDETPVDLMRVGNRRAINMVHFGFDSRVAVTMSRIKRKPFIGGRNAYYTAVLKNFLGPLSAPWTVRVDGELLCDGPMLLCTVACGQYVGGSFRCAPRSDNADGLLDIGLVKSMSHARFVSLIGAYTKGTHLDDPRLRDCLVYRRGTHVSVLAEPETPISLDGEILREEAFEICMEPQALRFVVPQGALKAPSPTA